MTRQAAVLTVEELNKDLRSLQKQTKETKYSSMMKLLRLALSGQQVKNKNSETGTFCWFFFFLNSYLLSDSKILICARIDTSFCYERMYRYTAILEEKAVLKVSERQKLSKYEYAGDKSEVRETSGPAEGSVGKVVGFGQNQDFMCNLLL